MGKGIDNNIRLNPTEGLTNKRCASGISLAHSVECWILNLEALDHRLEWIVYFYISILSFPLQTHTENVRVNVERVLTGMKRDNRIIYRKSQNLYTQFYYHKKYPFWKLYYTQNYYCTFKYFTLISRKLNTEGEKRMSSLFGVTWLWFNCDGSLSSRCKYHIPYAIN